MKDPWDDLINYFRDVDVTQIKYRLLADAVDQLAPAGPAQSQPVPDGGGPRAATSDCGG